MPVFECSRCNELTYSASADAAHTCARCGSVTRRAFEDGFEQARRSSRSFAAGDHAALVYRDPAVIAPFCARFLTDGVDAGERVVAGIGADLHAAVTPLLAPDVAVVIDWHEPRDLYTGFDSDRVASTYEAMLADDPRPTRILAGMDRESATGVDASELDCYERVAHGIITGHGATVVCVYDAGVLAPELLPVADRRHTLSVEDGVLRRNERFEYEPV